MITTSMLLVILVSAASAGLGAAQADCSATLGLCSTSGCCTTGNACLTPASTPAPGGYGDDEVGGYGFYGADPDTAPYSICAPPTTAEGSGVAGLDLRTLTIVEILDALASGAYTSEDITRAYLAQIARYEGVYNAFTFLAPDALAQARASDARRAAGGAVRSLEGVPTAIKEALNVAGFPSTLGWNYTYSGAGGVDLFPVANAALVQRLIDAGAVIIGKTNIPAFSASGDRTLSSWDGTTFNAVNPFLIPGASSAGTATSTAAGFAAWGVAEETGSSIQNPSSAQSLVGVRTTYGIVPNFGLAPLSASTKDVLGPIAKTVRDAAIALNAMTGYGSPAFVGKAPAGGYTALLGDTTLEGARIGILGPSYRINTSLSEGYQELYAEALQTIVGLGATLVEDPFADSGFAALAKPVGGYDGRGIESLPHDFFLYGQTLGVASFDEFVARVGVSPFGPGQQLEGICGGLPDPEFTVCARGLADPATPQDLSAFFAARAAYRNTTAAVFEERRLDALVFPQSLEILPPNFSDVGNNETSAPEWNIAGQPGVYVPSTRGTTETGAPAPFSLAFLGRPYDEAKLLALAYDYEQATQLRWVPDLLPELPPALRVDVGAA